MQSSHVDSPLSQACSSFIFQRGNESLNDNKSFSCPIEQRQQGSEDQQFKAQANQLPESQPLQLNYSF